MREQANSLIYRSPQRELVKFFKRSRDQWKEKCLEAKARIKRQRDRMRFLERSKEQWKSRVKALEQELKQLKQARPARQAGREDKKKSQADMKK